MLHANILIFVGVECGTSLLAIWLEPVYEYSWKIGNKIIPNSFVSSLLRLYSLVMILSSLVLLSYSPSTGICVKRSPSRVSQRVLARTVDEVEYYYRESTPPGSRFGRKSSPALKGFISISVSVHQILSIGSSRRLLMAQCSIYEILMISTSEMILWAMCIDAVQRTSLFQER